MTPADRVVLLALLRTGATTAKALAADLGRSYLRTYDALRRLERLGLTTRGPHRFAASGLRLGQLWRATATGREPMASRTPTVDDVIDSLRALGGTASAVAIAEDTGRDKALVRKALGRAGARRGGWDRGSRVWTLCSGADTL